MFDIELLIWVVPGIVGLSLYNRSINRKYYQLEGWEYLFAVVFFAIPYYVLIDVFPKQKWFYELLQLFFSVILSIVGLWFYNRSINRYINRNYYQLEGWEYLFAVVFFAIPYYVLIDIFPKQQWFHELLQLFFSIILSAALGWFSAWIRNNYFDDPTPSTFHNCCYSWHRKLIFVTLSNRKVYVGLLVDYTKSSRIEPAIKIVPIISGYRDERRKVDWTDRYPVFSKEELGEEAGLIMPYSQIINFSLWNLSTAYKDAPRINKESDQTTTES